MPSYRPVVAALPVLDVLAAVNALGDRAGLAELHRRTGLDKATLTRMLETLAHAGYVVRDEPGRSYRVTGKTLQLSAGYDRHRAVALIVGPALSAFRTRVGWPSDFALFDSDAMLVVETSRETGPIFINRRPGYRAPLLGTSLGLAYLAHSPEERQTAVLEAMAADPAPWNDLARSPQRARSLFADIRRRGYATMDPSYRRREYDDRIASIGVPVSRGDRLFGSINILFLLNALDPDQAAATLLRPLRETADTLAAALADRSSD